MEELNKATILENKIKDRSLVLNYRLYPLQYQKNKIQFCNVK